MKKKTVEIEVPFDVWAALRERQPALEDPAQALLTPLAVGLFVDGVISLAKAARLAGMSRYEFALFLKQRGIPAYEYTESTYQEDLNFISSLEG